MIVRKRLNHFTLGEIKKDKGMNMFKGFKLLELSSNRLVKLRPVTTSVVMDQERLDPNGLYSQEIFGDMQSPERLNKASYIELNIPVFQPDILDDMKNLGTIYMNVARGITTAKLVGGVLVEDEGGRSGIRYLLEIFPKIKWKTSDADSRMNRIANIKKAIKNNVYQTSRYLVLPAGLRDVSFDQDQRVIEHEINAFYKKIIIMSRAMSAFSNADVKQGMADSIHFKLQIAVYDIYNYIMDMILDGKHKLIRGSWTKREITYSTRNVLTGYAPNLKSLRTLTGAVDLNTATIGLYQFGMATLPLLFRDLSALLGQTITPMSDVAMLYDASKKMFVNTPLKQGDRDLFATKAGLNKIIKRLNNHYHNKPVEVGGKYLGALHTDGERVRYVSFQTDMTEMDTSKLSPITYDELFTIILNGYVKHTAGICTRYPVTGRGSTIPVLPNLRPTIRTVDRVIVYEDGREIRAMFPLSTKTFKSYAISFTRLAGQDADHDGDKVSYNAVFTKEAVDEINNLLNSAAYYIGPNGRIDADISYGTFDFLVKSLGRKDKK